MDNILQVLPVIIVLIVVYFLVKFYKPKSVGLVPESGSVISEEDKTFEEKMLLLQKESNKRLKGIDNTLDWFFWIMIISFIISFFYIVMSAGQF